MSDAMSDGDIFHGNGSSHSRRRSCAICYEEAESLRRSRMSDLGRRTEDLLKEITGAISQDNLHNYVQGLAKRLHEAEQIQKTGEEQLHAEYLRGVGDERERLRKVLK